MAGRGRGLTLPSWMTDPNSAVLPEKEATPAPVTTTTTSVVEVVPVKQPTPLPPPFPRPFLLPPPPMLNKPHPLMHPVQQMNLMAPHNSIPPSLVPPIFNPPPGMPYGVGNMMYPPPTNPPSIPLMKPVQPVMPPKMPTFPPSAPTNPLSSVNRGAAPSLPPSSVGDPTNDASCWGEHTSEAGKKYWYNRVTLVSTYEKPFCLKTPEERSIPPCIWKEYEADGKKFYSDGKESVWTMPEEFRTWKEKVDALQAKKSSQPPSRESITHSHINQPHHNNNSNASHGASNSSSNYSTQSISAEPAIVYASYAEASEAFKELMTEKKVSATAKMREVQDLCQADVRWDALKTMGEKKQALAEYQTRKLKQEKEVQKNKAKKYRDAFLLMLAENTEIDARTRWRDAVVILQDDLRFKNLEDVRDREELFKDFTLELEKKEKEDKRRTKEGAMDQFRKVLDQFKEEKKINRKSVWVESKKLFADVICKTEYRSLDDTDFRRVFQDFTSSLEEEYRKEERRKKADFEKRLESLQADLKSVLEDLVKQGKINVESRVKEVLIMKEVDTSEPYVKIISLCVSLDNAETKSSTACRDVVEQVITKVQDLYRSDKRVIKGLMSEHRVKIRYDTVFKDFRSALLKLARMKEVETRNGVMALMLQEDHTTGMASEEGEEFDSSTPLALRQMFLERPSSLEIIFKELHKKAVEDYEEDCEYMLKIEKKFNSVLAEYFYSPEHVNIPWDDAKVQLQKRSVYEALGKSDRKRLYGAYMQQLSNKFSGSKDRLELDYLDYGRHSKSVRSGEHSSTPNDRSHREENSDEHHRKKRRS